MDIHLLAPLLVLAVLSVIAGYQAEKNGWILMAAFPELILRGVWLLMLAAIFICWCCQAPFGAYLWHPFYFLTALCPPFWLGRQMGASGLSG